MTPAAQTQAKRTVLLALLAVTTPSMALAQAAPLPEITDAEREAAFPDVHGHTVHDRHVTFKALFDQLEWQYLHDKHGLRWDNSSWIGGDINRVWIKTEGEAVDGIVDAADVRVMYGRSFSRWWEWLGGVRQEIRPSPAETSFVVGLHGLAPQWFEVDATAAIATDGHASGRVEVEYEALVTNRLVVQPLVELSLSAGDDAERGIGAGLTTAEIGFRLRYEVSRELAPYIGVVWHRKLFGTADYARADGDDIGGWHLVAGLRTWF